MMRSVTCNYCGLPFKVREKGGAGSVDGRKREYFCCTGCAMLARVPVDEKGRFPVNAQLVSALAAGFLFFNQVLFWLLAALLAMQDRPALSARFCWIGGAAALVVWCVVAFAQWRERAARAADYAALAVALGAHAWVFANAFVSDGGIPRAWPMAVANAALIAWTMRGVLERRFFKRR